MATKKSTWITALDATPRTTPLTGGVAGGGVMAVQQKIEVAVADAAADIYRFFRLPWNAVILSLAYCCDALGTATFDWGTYAIDGGAVNDADEFASAVAGTATANWTEILGEANAASESLADRAEMQLWQVMDVATEPVGTMYDICATAVGEPDTAGTLAARILYTVG